MQQLSVVMGIYINNNLLTALNYSDMKKRILLFNLIPAILLGLTVASCSNDDDVTSVTGTLVIKPAKNPDFTIYSGKTTLSSTLDVKSMTRSEVTSYGAFSYIKYNWAGDTQLPETYRNQENIPTGSISDDEKTYIKTYISAHPEEAGVKFYNINYYVQYVVGSYDQYFGIKDNNGADHNIVGTNHMDYIEINGNHLNDYNSGFGPNALCLNLPLINPAYHDSYGDTDNTKYDSYKIYKITYNGKEGYYLGFDYKTKKSSGETFDGDGVYNDYVIKLTPADNPNSGGGGTVIDDDDNDSIGEVEVNLSVNAEKSEGDYIATKLSIHVRDTTDVEVFIPVIAEYYCDADDMNIVLSHKENAEEYNNTANYKSMSYEVAGQTVTLTVAYELGGIRVTTSGINKDVLKYLRTTYGDGITFEVWNYYKNAVTIDDVTSDVTRGEIKNKFLNNSTVTFTATTSRYVNAFGPLFDYPYEVYVKKITDENGVTTEYPYTDEALTQELDQTYWDRATDTRYYVLHSYANAWDCTVTPPTGYTQTSTELYNKIYTKE